MPLIEVLYSREEPLDRESKRAFAEEAVRVFREVLDTPPGRLRLAFHYLDPDDTLPALLRGTEDGEKAVVDVIVRAAAVGDAPELAGVLRELGFFRDVGEDLPDRTAALTARQLGMCQADDSHTVLVAELPGGVAGYLSVHWMPTLWGGLDGYVSELFVREDARGRGVGGALLDRIEAEGRRRGASRLMLFNRKVRDSYQRGFYQKRGWTEREDVAFFMKSLS